MNREGSGEGRGAKQLSEGRDESEGDVSVAEWARPRRERAEVTRATEAAVGSRVDGWIH